MAEGYLEKASETSAGWGFADSREGDGVAYNPPICEGVDGGGWFVEVVVVDICLYREFRGEFSGLPTQNPLLA